MQDDAESLEIRQRQEERWERATFVSIIAIIGSGILTFAAQEGMNPRRSGYSAQNACIANLRALDGVKATWALEQNQSSNAVPTDTDLFGVALYMREKPQCPQGGRYTLGRIDQKAGCSVRGHTF